MWTWRVKDWRPWAFIAVTLALGFADLTLPAETVILPYVGIPLAASAVLARPGFTLELLGLSVVLGGISAWHNDYTAGEAWRRLTILVLSGLVAAALAWMLRRNRDETLKQGERYQLIAENASDVVGVVGSDRRVEWVSPSVFAALGYSPDELIGTRLFDLVHPDDKPAIASTREEIFQGSLQSIEAGSMVARFRRKDGGFTWMSIRTTSFTSPSGEFVSAVSGLQRVDSLVAERERAEQVAATLDATMHAIVDPIVVLDVEIEDDEISSLTYVEANNAARMDLRIPEDFSSGDSLLDAFTDREDRRVLEFIVQALASPTPVEVDGFSVYRGRERETRRYDVRAQRISSARLCVTWRDVTERQSDLDALTESEENYRLLAANSTDVVLLAREGILRWLSPALTDALGWRPEEWVGRRFEDFTHPDDVALAQGRRAEISKGNTRVTTLRMRDSGGAYHWIEIHAGPYHDANGHQAGILASFRIVDDEVASQQALERRARFDALTGTLVRDEAVAYLSRAVSHPTRSGTRIGVLFCDLDRFKELNDRLGHLAGDDALKAVSERLRACVRSRDLVARMGGDEFLVILEGIHTIEDAGVIAEKIRLAVCESIPVTGGVAQLGISIGGTLATADEPVDELIARADAAMYRAKHGGRNRVVLEQSESVPGG